MSARDVSVERGRPGRPPDPGGTADSPPRPAPVRAGLGLAAVSLAQLILALNSTVLSVALVSVQHDLHLTDGDRQLVLTAYTVALAAGLLTGGRLVDRWGLRRVFLFGMVGFAAASGLTALAPDLIVLVVGRALQGLTGAMLLPAAVAALRVLYAEPRSRARAFAVYGAIATGGGVIGLLGGGLVTQVAGWRWCLVLNVVLAAVAIPLAVRALPGTPDATRRSSPVWTGLDVPGAALVALTLGSLVLACSRLAGGTVTDPSVWVPLVIAALGAAATFAHERRVADPVLPGWLITHPGRAAAFLAVAVAILGVFGLFLLLSYYLQVGAGYSAARTGVAFLPLSISSALGSWAMASRLGARYGPTVTIVPGLLCAGAGLALVSFMRAGQPYFEIILPAEVLVGLGAGAVIAPAINLATSDVTARFAGIAAAAVAAANQVGASVGTAVLTTVAVAATATRRAHAATASLDALVYGYTRATAVAAAILIVAALTVFWLLRLARRRSATERPSPPAAT